MLKYSAHRDNKEFFFDRSLGDLPNRYLDLDKHSELETFMDFSMFLKLYNADPENWKICKSYYRADYNGLCYHPVYIDKDYRVHVIKFSSRYNYRRFIRWRRREIRNHDDYENLQEQLQLSEMIRKRAMIKAKEASERVLQAQQLCHKYMLTPEEKESLPPWVRAVQETQIRHDNLILENGQRVPKMPTKKVR